MAPLNDDARHKANQIYMAGIECAKAEHDALMPEFAKLRERVGLLRSLIRAGSALVVPPLPVEDAYSFSPQPPLHQSRRGRS